MNPRSTTRSLYIGVIICLAVGIARGQQRDDCEHRINHSQSVIDYRTEGGPTGALWRWLFYSDGLACKWYGGRVPAYDPLHLRLPIPHDSVQVHWSFSERGTIPQEKLDALLDDITRLGFFKMARGTKLIGTCYQCMSRSITVRSATRKKTVETCDADKAVPELKEIISKIQQVISTAFQ